MPGNLLVLRTARNETERLAHLVVRGLEASFDLTARGSAGPWLVELLDGAARGSYSADVLHCAALSILQAGGYLSRDVQWSILSVAYCFDLRDLNERTRAQMGNVVLALQSLYHAFQTPTGVTALQFREIAADLIRFLMTEGDAAFRLQVSDIAVFRRCYAQLRGKLFGA